MNTWAKADATVIDFDQKSGTMSVFVDYDLLRWTFGARFERDPCWLDFVVEIGPVSVSFCYWRRFGK